MQIDSSMECNGIVGDLSKPLVVDRSSDSSADSVVLARDGGDKLVMLAV